MFRQRRTVLLGVVLLVLAIVAAGCPSPQNQVYFSNDLRQRQPATYRVGHVSLGNNEKYLGPGICLVLEKTTSDVKEILQS